MISFGGSLLSLFSVFVDTLLGRLFEMAGSPYFQVTQVSCELISYSQVVDDASITSYRNKCLINTIYMYVSV